MAPKTRQQSKPKLPQPSQPNMAKSKGNAKNGGPSVVPVTSSPPEPQPEQGSSAAPVPGIPKLQKGRDPVQASGGTTAGTQAGGSQTLPENLTPARVPPVSSQPLNQTLAELKAEVEEEQVQQTAGDRGPIPPINVSSRKRKKGRDDDDEKAPLAETETGEGTQRRPLRAASDEPQRRRRTDSEEIGVHLAYNFSFYTPQGKDYYREVISKRKLHKELCFNSPALKAAYWVNFMLYHNLYAWGSKFSEINVTLVHEFYSNLSPSFAEKESVWFGKAYVRGNLVAFNPTVLSALLEIPLRQFEGAYPANVKFDQPTVLMTLTNGTVSSCSEKGLRSDDLSLKFYMLFRLCASCILPTNHKYVRRDIANLLYAIEKRIPVNLPYIVMRQIAASAELKPDEQRVHLAFPALITKVLESNGVRRDPGDVIADVKTFALTKKLVMKVSDIPAPDGGLTRESLYVCAKRMIRECIEKYEDFARMHEEMARDYRAVREKMARALAMLPDTCSVDEGRRRAGGFQTGAADPGSNGDADLGSVVVDAENSA